MELIGYELAQQVCKFMLTNVLPEEKIVVLSKMLNYIRLKVDVVTLSKEIKTYIYETLPIEMMASLPLILNTLLEYQHLNILDYQNLLIKLLERHPLPSTQLYVTKTLRMITLEKKLLMPHHIQEVLTPLAASTHQILDTPAEVLAFLEDVKKNPFSINLNNQASKTKAPQGAQSPT